MEQTEIDEHNKKEKVIITFLKETTEEINTLFSKNKEGKSIIPDRPKLILIFTAIDIFYTYWQMYQNIVGNATKQSIAFPTWLDEFCLTEKNSTFSTNKKLKKINSQELYTLRCALVHFYGLPEKNSNHNILIASDSINEHEIITYEQKLDQKTKELNLIIQPRLIRDLIWDGGILMLKKMIDNIERNPKEHIAGINRVYSEVVRRSANKIEIAHP